MEQEIPLTSIDISTESIDFSAARPLIKVALLNILTFNLYSYYWFYCNWEDFKGRIWDQQSSSGLKTAGLFVPIVGMVLAYRHFREIRDELWRQDIVMGFSPFILAFGWQLRYALPRVLKTYTHLSWPIRALATYLLITCLLCAVQSVLNRYWQRMQPDLPMQGFSLSDKVVITLGSFAWIFALLGLADN